ncbi:MAG: hypothetical protein H8K04_05600 [Nitrospira sp.]
MAVDSCVAASATRSISNEALVVSKEAPVVTNVLLLMSGIRPPFVGLILVDHEDLGPSKQYGNA